jgi:putative membrane protein
MTRPVETQPERTALAWQRTGLGVLAVAALLANRALASAHPAFLVAAGVTALMGLAVLGGLAPLRARHVRRADSAGVAAPRAVAAVTAAVVATCVVAAVGVVAGN